MGTNQFNWNGDFFMILNRGLVSVFILIGINACVSSQPPANHEEKDILNSYLSEEILPEIPEPKVAELEEEIPFIDIEENADHPMVKKWVEYFSQNRRDLFSSYMKRGSQYRPMIEQILSDQGVPKELFYLALIESGFKLNAYSKAHAVGPWQFIKGTGKRFGLRINRYVDERRDPIRSTIAAAKYLKSLYAVFYSWDLALAAYNSGESRVMNAIIKHSERNFWNLVKLKALPRETKNYVPKLIAAAIVGSQLEDFGFDLAASDAQIFPEMISVKFPAPLHLRDIAKNIKINVKTIKKYNPHLKSDKTPPGASSYRLWIPKNIEYDQSNIAALKPLKKRIFYTKRLRKGKKRYFKYRIARGENLTKIAKKFSSSVRNIKKINRLNSNRIKYGTYIKIPRKNNGHLTKYKVRRGDSLYLVARRFGMTIKDLKRLNAIRKSHIYTGQWLKVYSRPG